MFDRIATSWTLIRRSARVLSQDKELLLFPLMSGIACLIVMASFLVPAWFNRAFFEGAQENDAAKVVAGVMLFLFYVVNYFVIIFFNAAMIACAVIRFEGRNPTLADGFRASFSRLPQIFGWAVVSATVGMILRLIESRSERFGQIVAGVLGMAWSATTFFVVPIVVVERMGPIEAVKRSLSLLRSNWGEALVVNFGVGFLNFLGGLVAAVPFVLGVIAMSKEQYALGIAGIASGIFLMILLALVTSALQAISLAAVYVYAADHKVPEAFDEHDLSMALVAK